MGATTSITTAGGRRIAYGTFGPSDGFPVVYLHGAIGSPLRKGDAVGAAVTALGLRLVAPARPGFGGSDPLPGRTLAGHARDVAAVADHLGLERFAVLGVSAGGPYAVACAAVLDDRCCAAAVVSSLTPGWTPDALPAHLRIGLRTIARHPRATTRAGDALVARLDRRPALLRTLLRGGAPCEDRGDLADPAAGDAAVAAFRTATAGGVGPLIDDHLLTRGPWGFAPQDVAGAVQLWHGAGDRFSPVDHAVALGAALPRCTVRIAPDEGHFFFRRHAAEILGALVREDAVLRTRARRAAPPDRRTASPGRAAPPP